MSERVDIEDDASSLITYKGGWSLVGDLATNSNEYNKTLHTATSEAASFSYSYYGGRVSIYGTIDSPGSKGVPVSTYKFDNLNDEDRTVFNSSGISGPVNSDGITSHVLFYQSPATTVAQHTVTVTVWNVSANGAKFYFDFITFDQASDTASNRYILDDNDSGIQYSGSWTSGNTQGEYLGTHHQASSGASATIRWTGVQIQVVATIPANDTPSPLISFKLDSEDSGTYTPPSTNAPVQHETVFIKRGLSAGDHELVMSTVGSQSWALDYIVIRPNQDGGDSNENDPVGGGSGGNGGGSSSGTNSASGSNPTSSANNGNLPGIDPGNLGGNGGSGGDEPKTVSKAAIAGGVLGGLAGLAFLLTAIWFLRRRRQLRRERVRETYKLSSQGIPAYHEEPPVSPFIITANHHPTQNRDSQYPSEKAARFRHSVSRASATTATAALPLLNPIDENSTPNSNSNPNTTTTYPTSNSNSHSHSDSRSRSGSHPMTSSNSGGHSSGTEGAMAIPSSPEMTASTVSPRRPRRRELDGGVRLASGDDDDDFDEGRATLPPAYARYS